MQLILQLAPLVLITSLIGVGFYVYILLKSDIHQMTRRIQKQQEQYDALQANVACELERASIRLKEAEERAGVLVAPLPPRSGLNLSKRSQALRMSRIGEKPENIAAALSLPRKEVELLLKIQKIVLSSNNATS